MKLAFWLAFASCLFAQTADDAAAWVNLRQRLVKDEAYLEQIRNSYLPVTEGTIVSMEPAARPHVLMIGIETPLVAELRLEIQRNGESARMHTTPVRKSKIHFRTALPTAVTKRPFVLTAVVDEMELDYEGEE